MATTERDAALEQWAASDVPITANDSNILRGPAAQVYGRGLLETVSRGRQPLDPRMAKGETSPRRQVRLPKSLSDAVDELAARENRAPSAVMRAAIQEYISAANWTTRSPSYSMLHFPLRANPFGYRKCANNKHKGRKHPGPQTWSFSTPQPAGARTGSARLAGSINCNLQMDSPHYSSGAKSVIAKARMSCTGGSGTVTISMHGDLGLVPGGTKTTGDVLPFLPSSMGHLNVGIMALVANILVTATVSFLTRRSMSTARHTLPA